MVRTTFIAAANARLRFGVTTGAAPRSDSFVLERLTTRVPFDLIFTFTLSLKCRGLGSPRERLPFGTIMTPKRSGRRKACNDLGPPLLQMIVNQSRQPMPRERRDSIRTPLARRGCALR